MNFKKPKSRSRSTIPKRKAIRRIRKMTDRLKLRKVKRSEITKTAKRDQRFLI